MLFLYSLGGRGSGRLGAVPVQGLDLGPVDALEDGGERGVALRLLLPHPLQLVQRVYLDAREEDLAAGAESGADLLDDHVLHGLGGDGAVVDGVDGLGLDVRADVGRVAGVCLGDDVRAAEKHGQDER